MPKLTGLPPVPSLPGPPPFPLLGFLPQALRYVDDPIRTFNELRGYGDVVAVSRHSAALVCVFGAQRNRDVLANPGVFRHDEQLFTGPPGSCLARLEHALVLINGEAHRRHRKLLMPAFSKAALASYAGPIVEIAESMVEDWPVDEVIDIDARLREMALAVAMRTLFGVDMRTDASQLGELASRWVAELAAPLAMALKLNLPGLPFRRALRLGDQVLALVDHLIATKRAQKDPGDDALARLLFATDDEEVTFTDEEVVSEVVTLFIAGHETTAMTMSWTMLMLERHPDVLADVFDELDDVLGDRSVTPDDVANLPLLDRVIKESMRVLPSVPTVFPRVVANAIDLGDAHLPQGANVIISPYATHHDPELFPDPERFSPERWETIKPGPYEYIPFGAGPRVCIGGTFARQSLPLILATVLRRVRMQVLEGTRIDRLVRANILRPKSGIPALLERPHRDRRPPAEIQGNIHEMVALR